MSHSYYVVGLRLDPKYLVFTPPHYTEQQRYRKEGGRQLRRVIFFSPSGKHLAELRQLSVLPVLRQYRLGGQCIPPTIGLSLMGT